MIEELMLSNQILACFVLGAIGGLIKMLNFDKDDKFSIEPMKMLAKSFVSGVCGLAIYLFSFDISMITPHKRLGLALASGYAGVSIFAKLIPKSLK